MCVCVCKCVCVCVCLELHYIVTDFPLFPFLIFQFRSFAFVLLFVLVSCTVCGGRYVCLCVCVCMCVCVCVCVCV